MRRRGALFQFHVDLRPRLISFLHHSEFAWHEIVRSSPGGVGPASQGIIPDLMTALVQRLLAATLVYNIHKVL